MSQKGSENTIASMRTQQKHKQIQKTDIKQPYLRARYTHRKAKNDKLSIHAANRHGIEARHGKNNNIECMDQQQQAWQHCKTC